MRAAYEAKGVGFLALSVDPDLDDVTEAAQKMGLRFIVAAGDSAVMAPWHQRQVPDTLYLKADGQVLAFDRGPRTRADFEARVKELMAAR